MNTKNIKIGGLSFEIDSEAYQLLEDYMNQLDNHFDAHPEKEEILSDIEVRMGELLAELKSSDHIVSMPVVLRAISTLGRPDEIKEDHGIDLEYDPEDSVSNTKKFYRDRDRKKIAGVCAGVASYFSWDVTLVRIGFVVGVLAGFGFPIFLYIFLWIVSSYANTPKERLAMRGERINIVNIAEEIDKNLGRLGSALTDLAQRVDKGSMKFF